MNYDLGGESIEGFGGWASVGLMDDLGSREFLAGNV
jgi:hypothetical protein